MSAGALLLPGREGYGELRPAALSRAEEIAAKIVAAAQADAHRTLVEARNAGASRELELVSRIETICSVARDDCAELIATARGEAGSRLAAGEQRARQITAHAQRESDRVRADARGTVHELQQRTERRRVRLESELRSLVKERDNAARELAAVVSALRAASNLIGAVQEPGCPSPFVHRVRPSLRLPARRAALVLVPLAIVAVVGYALVRSTSASALLHDDVRPAAAVSPPSAPLCPIPAAYRSAFVSAAKSQSVPLALLVSVATAESQFDANAKSTAGAVGLLQLLPSTAGSLRIDPNSPESNVLGGATYLHQMLDQFGSTELALAAYNAGPTAVARGAIPASTLQYVSDVMQTWGENKGCR